MLKLKLVQKGRKGARSFKIVVQPDREKHLGRVRDTVGAFNPKGNTLTVDNTKVEEWLKKGARPTAAVAKLLNLKPPVS